MKRRDLFKLLPFLGAAPAVADPLFLIKVPTQPGKSTQVLPRHYPEPFDLCWKAHAERSIPEALQRAVCNTKMREMDALFGRERADE